MKGESERAKMRAKADVRVVGAQMKLDAPHDPLIEEGVDAKPRSVYEMLTRQMLEQMKSTTTYAGKSTKRSIKTEKLFRCKQQAYDEMWLPEAIPVGIRKVLPEELIHELKCLVSFD